MHFIADFLFFIQSINYVHQDATLWGISEWFSEQCERLTRVQKGRFQVKYRAQGEGWHSTASRPLLQHHPEILSAAAATTATYSLPRKKNGSTAELNSISGSLNTGKDVNEITCVQVHCVYFVLNEFIVQIVWVMWCWWNVEVVIKKLFWHIVDTRNAGFGATASHLLQTRSKALVVTM